MWCWTAESTPSARTILDIADASFPLRVDATAGAYPSMERHSLHTNAAFLKSKGEQWLLMESTMSDVTSLPASLISHAEPDGRSGEDTHLEGTPSATSGSVFEVAKWLRRRDLLVGCCFPTPAPSPAFSLPFAPKDATRWRFASTAASLSTERCRVDPDLMTRAGNCAPLASNPASPFV